MAEGPRRTLRARLAIWMIASTAFTLIAFAGALYISLSYEERDDQPTASSEALGVDASEQVLLSMLVAGPLALAVAVGGALVLSKRALAPLHDVIAGARSITASGLHRRLALPTRRDELHALVRHLNELFGRLEQGFGALSRYATEASHELRTPLAVIASELEIALLRPRTNEEWERTARASLHEIRGMARVSARDACQRCARVGDHRQALAIRRARHRRSRDRRRSRRTRHRDSDAGRHADRR